MYCGFISSGSGAPIARTCHPRYSSQKPFAFSSPTTSSLSVSVSVFTINTESYHQPTASISLFSTGLPIYFRYRIINVKVVSIQSTGHIFWIHTSLTLNLGCCPPIWGLPNHRELQTNTSFGRSNFCPACPGRLPRY